MAGRCASPFSFCASLTNGTLRLYAHPVLCGECVWLDSAEHRRQRAKTNALPFTTLEVRKSTQKKNARRYYPPFLVPKRGTAHTQPHLYRYLGIITWWLGYQFGLKTKWLHERAAEQATAAISKLSSFAQIRAPTDKMGMSGKVKMWRETADGNDYMPLKSKSAFSRYLLRVRYARHRWKLRRNMANRSMDRKSKSGIFFIFWFMRLILTSFCQRKIERSGRKLDAHRV